MIRHSAIVPCRHCPMRDSSSRRSAARSVSLRFTPERCSRAITSTASQDRSFLIREIEQRPDLLDGETEIARPPREGEATGVRSRVVAVIACRAGRRGQKADALVIANGFHFGIRCACQLADIHAVP